MPSDFSGILSFRGRLHLDIRGCFTEEMFYLQRAGERGFGETALKMVLMGVQLF